MKTKLLAPALLFAAAALAPAIASAQTALISYTFDGNTPGAITGVGTVVNAVIPGTDNGTISTNGGTQYGQISSNGVSGSPGDYAYYDTTTNNTGGNYAGSGILVGGSPSSVSLTLTSFTMALWYNGSQTITNGTRLLSIGGTAGTGIGDLVFLNSLNSTTAQSNQLEFTTSSGTLATATIANNQWNFVALTYSLSGTTATYSIYVGTTSATATLLSTGTATVTGSMSITALAFGSTATNTRALPGLLDDINVYGSTSGSSSAMDLSQIQSLQQSALSAIPEPSTFALLVGFLSLGLVAGRGFVRRSRAVAPAGLR